MTFITLMRVCIFSAVLLFVFAIRREKEGTKNTLRDWIAPDTDEFGTELLETDEASITPSALPFLGKLEAEARKAGLAITGRALVLVALVVGTGAFTLSMALINNFPISCGASLLGLFAPRCWISLQKKKRDITISKQMDGALGLMSSALRGSASLAQAIQQAANNMPEPLGLEFQRVVKGIDLGLSPSEALTIMRDRTDSPDVDLMVTATQILFQTGGNLAEIYEKLAETVRERRAFKESVKAATAQARMSGMVVSLMPIGLTILVRMMNPHYYDPMLASVTGKMIFLGCFALILVGWMLIQRMLDVTTD